MIDCGLWDALASLRVKLLINPSLFLSHRIVPQPTIGIREKSVDCVIPGVRIGDDAEFLDAFLDSVLHYESPTQGAVGVPNAGIHGDRPFEERYGLFRLAKSN